ncbi:Hypothetical predicted protein [Mytilus galloprovincialis]|uniref:Tyr recombinase domain-containing protein n=1 Tax=Mytilus galloprovincialis TaxID=29158 RepID=A0A8B6FCX4_MYTGA|nr:Hypothetical predicted protein [Mytilus galloprovincialis]
MVAIILWGSELRNKKVLFHIDNEGAVHIINKKSSKSSDVMVLVRRLVLETLHHNILIKADHVPATVRLYISGISFSHKERNLEDTTKNFVVSKMLEGLHRNHPQRDNRAPVTLPLLRQITDALPSICSSTYESLLFKSSFILAFFAMLRVSEFTTKNKSDSSTEALQLSDVVVSDCQLKINIKKSKTDQRGYSTFIVINKYRDNANICPVLTLKKYLAARPAVSGCYHLFMHFDGSPLNPLSTVSYAKKVS